MPLDKSLFAELRGLDRHELRRVVMYARGLLRSMGDVAGAEARPEDAGPTVTYRQETVRCGKAGCRSCPHGPYWYAYWREGGKLVSRYLGIEEPEGIEGDRPPPNSSAAQHGKRPTG